MSLSDPQRMARLEWLTARLVFALGVAVIVGGFFAPTSFRAIAPQNGNPAAPPAAAAPPAQTSSPGEVFCSTAIAVAQNYGTVPTDVRANSIAHKTDVRGRYVCSATNGSVEFTVAVELECPNIHDQSCFSLYAVKSADGTVLYQRQQ
jgi:hypothetical protein